MKVITLSAIATRAGGKSTVLEICKEALEAKGFKTTPKFVEGLGDTETIIIYRPDNLLVSPSTKDKKPTP